MIAEQGCWVPRASDIEIFQLNAGFFFSKIQNTIDSPSFQLKGIVLFDRLRLISEIFSIDFIIRYTRSVAGFLD